LPSRVCLNQLPKMFRRRKPRSLNLLFYKREKDLLVSNKSLKIQLSKIKKSLSQSSKRK